MIDSTMTNKKTDIFQQSSDILCAYIDQHQMHHTAERMVILQAICQLQSFTVDELRKELTELNISRATVYNTLVLLEKAEIIHRLDKEFGVRATQYELIMAMESSVQVICARCGRVSKIKDTTIHRMLADKKWTNFVPDHFSLYVYGQCKKCRRKINKL
jgi:Fur family ferric uptake transcriptional regulator